MKHLSDFEESFYRRLVRLSLEMTPDERLALLDDTNQAILTLWPTYAEVRAKAMDDERYLAFLRLALDERAKHGL